MRQFESGATRDDDKIFDPEGFLSPIVLRRYCEYMTGHRKQADGQLRASDNWIKGIPKDAYIKSAWRHLLAWWLAHRGHRTDAMLEDSLCALMFNTMGYLFELLEARGDCE